MDRERLRNRFRLPFRCLVGVISTMSFESSSSELSEISWDSMLRECRVIWNAPICNGWLTELAPGFSAMLGRRCSPLLLLFLLRGVRSSSSSSSLPLTSLSVISIPA
jgi:hypothetical protein